MTTTFIQVFTRSFQVWVIDYGFPNVANSSYAYASMVFAWSLADAVRYSYFVVLLGGLDKGVLFRLLKWLRLVHFIFRSIYLFLGIGVLGIGHKKKKKKKERERILTFIRYTIFLVLYPIGIGGEWWLISKAASTSLSSSNSLLAGVFYFILALYAPGNNYSFLIYLYII